MKTVRHHLIAQLRRGLQGHFGRVWEGFEIPLIRNKDLLFPKKEEEEEGEEEEEEGVGVGVGVGVGTSFY